EYSHSMIIHQLFPKGDKLQKGGIGHYETVGLRMKNSTNSLHQTALGKGHPVIRILKQYGFKMSSEKTQYKLAVRYHTYVDEDGDLLPSNQEEDCRKNDDDSQHVTVNFSSCHNISLADNTLAFNGTTGENLRGRIRKQTMKAQESKEQSTVRRSLALRLEDAAQPTSSASTTSTTLQPPTRAMSTPSPRLHKQRHRNNSPPITVVDTTPTTHDSDPNNGSCTESVPSRF